MFFWLIFKIYLQHQQPYNDNNFSTFKCTSFKNFTCRFWFFKLTVSFHDRLKVDLFQLVWFSLWQKNVIGTAIKLMQYAWMFTSILILLISLPIGYLVYCWKKKFDNDRNRLLWVTLHLFLRLYIINNIYLPLSLKQCINICVNFNKSFTLRGKKNSYCEKCKNICFENEDRIRWVSNFFLEQFSNQGLG